MADTAPMSQQSQQPSPTSPPSPPSGTPGVSPSPESATNATANNPFTRAAPENPAPRNKGGRPAGSRDKRPRRSPRARASAPADAGEPRNNSADEARSPLEGEVAGEREQRERAKSGKRSSERERKARNVMDMFPLADVADNVIDMGNMLIVGIGSKRYGPSANALAFGADEKAFLSPLMVEVLKDMDIQLTPGEALGLVAVFLLAQKVALLESDLAMRRAKPVGPAPAGTESVNAEAAISRHNDQEAP